MERKRMDMVTETQYDASGLKVLYGTGEYHEPGTLPDGVPHDEVLADEAQIAGAPAHAQSPDLHAAQEEKRAEFERIQTERSGQLATDVLTPADGAPEKTQDTGTVQQAAKSDGKAGTTATGKAAPGKA